MRDLIANPRSQLLFVLPGRDETLRVKGDAWLTDDPELLASLPDRGKVPKLAIGLTVRTAFLQCAKALKRSGVWRPDEWPDISDVPSSASMFRDHIALDDLSVDQIQGILDRDYRETLY